jgi:hypothetical protein
MPERRPLSLRLLLRSSRRRKVVLEMNPAGERRVAQNQKPPPGLQRTRKEKLARKHPSCFSGNSEYNLQVADSKKDYLNFTTPRGLPAWGPRGWALNCL